MAIYGRSHNITFHWLVAVDTDHLLTTCSPFLMLQFPYKLVAAIMALFRSFILVMEQRAVNRIGAGEKERPLLEIMARVVLLVRGRKC